MMQFKKAEKAKAKLRLAISGPSGSGKTFSALAIGTELGERVAVIDTENGSASLYADRFGFEVLDLAPPYDPLRYVQAIEAAEAAGFDVLVIDSLSHEWNGKGGCLEMVDDAGKRFGGNKHYAWAEVTPKHNALVEKINRSSLHIVATMRSKTTWAEETDDRGRKSVKKLGMAPVQRDGMEYEFTLHGEMNHDHDLIVSKSRCFELQDKVINKPGKDVAATLKAWLDSGVDAPAPPAAAPKERCLILAALCEELAPLSLSPEVEKLRVGAESLAVQGGTADAVDKAIAWAEKVKDKHLQGAST